jgi:glucosyl-dolichyl phosphate glucuronosyltransferase
MLVTVAICTWNRADLLDQTLTRMAELVIPEGVTWELLVVNNNATDHTEEVIQKHFQAGRLPLQALFEKEQGLSRARNKAISEFRGELLLWTDDDVLVSPNWLAAHVKASLEYPDAAAFGGPIEPWFPVPPPKWFTRNIARLGPYWALLERPSGKRILDKGEHVFGANMVYRREAIAGKLFNVNAGHIGKKSGGFDEIEIQEAIEQSGRPRIWVPEAVVTHYVIPERMNLAYLWQHLVHVHYKRFYDPADFTGSKRVFDIPRWLLRTYIQKRVLLALRSLNRDDRWVDAFLEAARVGGLVAGAQEESTPQGGVSVGS